MMLNQGIIRQKFTPNIEYFWGFRGFSKMHFGLSTGPHIFTKVVRPLVQQWRCQALRIVVYLDDGLGGLFGTILLVGAFRFDLPGARSK